jgi:hypothetical protein
MQVDWCSCWSFVGDNLRFQLDLITGRVGFGSGHVGLPGQNSWPALDPPCGWVGFFLGSSENLGSRPTNHTVGLGRGGGFFRWVGLGLSGRAVPPLWVFISLAFLVRFTQTSVLSSRPVLTADMMSGTPRCFVDPHPFLGLPFLC